MFDLTAIPKGFLLGLGSAIPLGPIALLVINNTIKHNRRQGMATGIGGSLADTLFAAISLLTISIFHEFITDNRDIIAVTGGFIITFAGLFILLKDKTPDNTRTDSARTLSIRNKLQYGMIAQSFLLAISNPGALFWSISLISILKIGKMTDNITSAITTLCFVFIGSVTYWIVATKIISKLRSKIEVKHIATTNKYTAAAIIIFGIIVIIQGLTGV